MERIADKLGPGRDYAAVCRELYGHHSDRGPKSLRARLPYYGEVLRDAVVGGTGKEHDPPEKRYGRIANVTVHVALNRLRELMNALIAEYGPPRQVVVELLRELHEGAEKRRVRRSRDNAREEANQQLDEEIRADGLPVLARANERRRRWRLWKAQDCACIFTGKPICASELFTDAVNVEHILPRSRGGFNRPDNVVLARKEANSAKRDHTPVEAFSDATSPLVNWDSFVARVDNLYRKGEQLEAAARAPSATAGSQKPAGSPGRRQHDTEKEKHARAQAEQIAVFRVDSRKRHKLLKLRCGDISDDGEGWLPRQIADAGHGARLAMRYMRHICPVVWSTKGQLTAGMRDDLGLRKDRSRHANHFIDAVAVALMERSRIQRHQRAWARTGTLPKESLIPWPLFTPDTLEHAARLIPHQTPEKHLGGQLHNEFHYSLWQKVEGGWRRFRWASAPSCQDQDVSVWRLGLREKATDLFPNSGTLGDEEVRKRLQRVIDPGLSNAAESRAAKQRIDLLEAARQVLQKRAADGYPVRGIECWFSDRGKPLDLSWEKLRTVPRGNHRAQIRTDGNHCMEVWEEVGEWKWQVSSLFDVASNRSKEKKEKRLLIARLHIGDLIEITRKGSRDLWRVRSFVASGRVRLWPAQLAIRKTTKRWHRSAFPAESARK